MSNGVDFRKLALDLREQLTTAQCELGIWKTKACEAAEREAALREELATAKRAGPPHFCGLPMSLNPHPEAGVPGRFLEVGTVSECIPCLVASRHGWAKTASDLQQRLTAAEQRNAELVGLLCEAVPHFRDLASIRDERGQTACSGELYALADTYAALKPTESGASE